MDVKQILEMVRNNQLSIEEAMKLLSNNHTIEIESIANYDVFREHRTLIPEIVYCETKTPEQVKSIVEIVMEHKSVLMLSRLRPEIALMLESFSDIYQLYFGSARNFCVITTKDYVKPKPIGKIGIITAGTSVIPIAEEAQAIAELMGCETFLVTDVGVAGIHRLFDPLKELFEKDVDVLIVAAGMEGALPTVVAGLVDIPVIGLPISVGYGYGGKGQAALMSMLQSCSLGVAVVNIDAGISAGAIAAKIARRMHRFTHSSNSEFS